MFIFKLCGMVITTCFKLFTTALFTLVILAYADTTLAGVKEYAELLKEEAYQIDYSALTVEGAKQFEKLITQTKELSSSLSPSLNTREHLDRNQRF